jgi:Ca2+-binding EF-hand superfamily protein
VQHCRQSFCGFEDMSRELPHIRNNNTTALSHSEWQDLRDAFVLLDTQNKGEISINELRSVLQELEKEQGAAAASCTGSSSNNLQRLLSSLENTDTPMLCDDRLLTLDDFVQLLTTPNPDDTRDEIEKVYELFDLDAKGYIDVADLRQVAADLGEYGMTDAELQEMVHRVTGSTTGKVSIDQFRDIMNKKLFS